jgi:cell division inhibitor SepF
MDDFEPMDKPGIFGRLANVFTRPRDDEEYEPTLSGPTERSRYQHHLYQITVRRQIVSFQDAVAAADGLKRGEQQILNLTQADEKLREKIKDFMCGVNYAQDASMEEIGDHIYLLAPPNALVEVAPSSPRMAAAKN